MSLKCGVGDRSAHPMVCKFYEHLDDGDFLSQELTVSQHIGKELFPGLAILPGGI